MKYIPLPLYSDFIALVIQLSHKIVLDHEINQIPNACTKYQIRMVITKFFVLQSTLMSGMEEPVDEKQSGELVLYNNYVY